MRERRIGKIEDIHEDVKQQEGIVRRKIVDLNKFLKQLKIKVEANPISEFELGTEMVFCLIEKC